jgi:hypothetical protein
METLDTSLHPLQDLYLCHPAKQLDSGQSIHKESETNQVLVVVIVTIMIYVFYVTETTLDAAC